MSAITGVDCNRETPIKLIIRGKKIGLISPFKTLSAASHVNVNILTVLGFPKSCATNSVVSLWKFSGTSFTFVVKSNRGMINANNCKLWRKFQFLNINVE